MCSVYFLDFRHCIFYLNCCVKNFWWNLNNRQIKCNKLWHSNNFRTLFPIGDDALKTFDFSHAIFSLLILEKNECPNETHRIRFRNDIWAFFSFLNPFAPFKNKNRRFISQIRNEKWYEFFSASSAKICIHFLSSIAFI